MHRTQKQHQHRLCLAFLDLGITFGSKGTSVPLATMAFAVNKTKKPQRCVILRALMKDSSAVTYMAIYIFPIYSNILARQRVGSVTPDTVNLLWHKGS